MGSIQCLYEISSRSWWGVNQYIIVIIFTQSCNSICQPFFILFEMCFKCKQIIILHYTKRNKINSKWTIKNRVRTHAFLGQTCSFLGIKPHMKVLGILWIHVNHEHSLISVCESNRHIGCERRFTDSTFARNKSNNLHNYLI